MNDENRIADIIERMTGLGWIYDGPGDAIAFTSTDGAVKKTFGCWSAVDIYIEENPA